jgi:hypothetical protein
MTSDVIVLPRLFDFKILSVHGEKKNLSCGVVAQWSSRLPQEQKIAGSSPVWVLGILCVAVLLLKLNMHCHCKWLRKINA